MINIRRGLYSLFVIVLLISSCKTNKEAEKEEVEEKKVELKATKADVVKKETQFVASRLNDDMLNRYKESLHGDWNWLKTICCARTPQTLYAKDAEKSKTINFSPEGIYTEYENGQVVSKKDYEVGNALNDRRLTLLIGDYRTAIMHIKEDTLVLDYGYMDLEITYYTRNNETSR